jgi:hypothetical protein
VCVVAPQVVAPKPPERGPPSEAEARARCSHVLQGYFRTTSRHVPGEPLLTQRKSLPAASTTSSPRW